MAEGEQLLVHLGGLGDLCLSESAICSVTKHFPERTVALGYTRFLVLFHHYFHRIEWAESRQWATFFSGGPLPQTVWKRIVFVGKDRRGSLRKKWRSLSDHELIFIDMYPEMSSTPGEGECDSNNMIVDEGRGYFRKNHSYKHPTKKVHVEEYQLNQLRQYRIMPVKVDVPERGTVPIILYPEKGYRKNKWDLDKFLILYKRIKEAGHDVCFLEQQELSLDVADKRSFCELTGVKDFLSGGGLLISNDSGMAHLAGALGLATITIFTDHDPDVWHPRGRNVSFRSVHGTLDIEKILQIIKISL